MSACNFCPDGTDLARKSPPTCKKCYNKQYKRPREKCIECKRNKEIHTKDGRCDSCYRKTYDRIMEICSICKELNEVKKKENGLPICNRCYKSPKRLCFGCKEEKEICVSTPFPICRNCRNKERKLVDEQFRISTILRQRVYFALKTFGGGKIKSADEYGINYVKIIEHLSPFPEDTSLYHIDHIFPPMRF